MSANEDYFKNQENDGNFSNNNLDDQSQSDANTLNKVIKKFNKGTLDSTIRDDDTIFSESTKIRSLSNFNIQNPENQEKKEKKFKPDFNNLDMTILDQIIEFCGLEYYHFKLIFCQIIVFVYYGFLINILPSTFVPFAKFNDYNLPQMIVLSGILIVGIALGNVSIRLQYKITTNRIDLLKINFMISILWLFIFSVGRNYWLFFFTRLLSGFHLGFIFPVQNNLFLEAFPHTKKIFIFICMVGFIAFGQFIILVLEIWIMPEMKGVQLPEYYLVLSSISFIFFVIYCINIQDSPKNMIGNQSVAKGFKILKNEIIKDRGFKNLEKLKKVVLFELHYPFVAVDLKEKRLKEIEQEKGIIKEDSREHISQDSKSGSVKKSKSQSKKSEEKTIDKKQNSIEMGILSNKKEEEIPLFKDQENNEEQEGSFKEPHLFTEKEIAEMEKKLATTDKHMFDDNYRLVSICNLSLLIQIFFTTFGMGVLQNQLADEANKIHIKKQNPINSILFQIYENCYGMFTPIIAGVLVEYATLGLKYSLLLCNILMCALFILCLVNYENAVYYAGIGNGLNVFLASIVFCLVSKTYDIRISDKSVGILYIIANSTIIAGAIVMIFVPNVQNVFFIVFLVLAGINIFISIFYPVLKTSKNRM